MMTKGLDIRWHRRRLGLSQAQLAERLGVDQGTVSRWERGIEQPRPANHAALRDMFIYTDGRRALLRQFALIRNDVLPAGFCDAKNALRMYSGKAERHHLQRYGFSPSKFLGQHVERQYAFTNSLSAWQLLEDTGLGREDIMLIRGEVNFGGKGHVTVIEPTYEEGEYIGWFTSVVETFAYPETTPNGLRRLDVLYAESPEQMVSFIDRENAAAN